MSDARPADEARTAIERVRQGEGSCGGRHRAPCRGVRRLSARSMTTRRVHGTDKPAARSRSLLFIPSSTEAHRPDRRVAYSPGCGRRDVGPS